MYQTMKIMKFGGSSVADSNAVSRVSEIISGRVKGGEKIVVVVSAMAGVTDRLESLCGYVESKNEGVYDVITAMEQKHLSVARELISIARQPQVLAEVLTLFNQLTDIIKGAFLVGEVTARTKDMILSYGEQLSGFILANVLADEIPGAFYSDARKLIITDSDFGRARVNFEITGNMVRDKISTGKGTAVIPGFIAGTFTGETTTLGRNGSDYSASVLGAALGADAIEIWTDTNGVMTADPSIVSEARSIRQLSYNEAMELSHFGARVIYPASLLPAMRSGIPVIVKNTFNPGDEGTVICKDPSGNGTFIRGITSLGKISMLSVEGCGMVGVAGVAARLFTALSGAGISVILISQASSEHSICLCIPGNDAQRAKSILAETFLKELVTGAISSVTSEDQLAIVAVVGENMRNTPGVAAKVFDPLGKSRVNIKAISQGSSELNISFVIHERDLGTAMNALHKSMFH